MLPSPDGVTRGAVRPHPLPSDATVGIYNYWNLAVNQLSWHLQVYWNLKVKYDFERRVEFESNEF